MTTKTTTEQDSIINTLKNRIVRLEKDEATKKFAKFILTGLETYIGPSDQKLDFIQAHLEEYAQEITDINNK